MAYTWTDGELITAAKLNNTGGGGGLVVYDDGAIDKSYNELKAMLDNGVIPYFVTEEIDGDDIYYDIFRLTSLTVIGGNEYDAMFVSVLNAPTLKPFIQSSADDPMLED